MNGVMAFSGIAKYPAVSRDISMTVPHKVTAAEIKPGIQPLSSVQFSSVTQSCPTLCDPMNRSMPGLPIHHQLPESTQTHAHQVGDAIQPSHPLFSPSPPALNLPSIRVFTNS